MRRQHLGIRVAFARTRVVIRGLRVSDMRDAPRLAYCVLALLLPRVLSSLPLFSPSPYSPHFFSRSGNLPDVGPQMYQHRM